MWADISAQFVLFFSGSPASGLRLKNMQRPNITGAQHRLKQHQEQREEKDLEHQPMANSSKEEPLYLPLELILYFAAHRNLV